MAFRPMAVVKDPIGLDALNAWVERTGRERGEGCGAVCAFLGVVRATHKNRRVRFLEYEAHEPLAVRTFEAIARETADRWPEATLAIHHRTGRLEIGEASVAIAAATAHRAESFAVCRYAIERIKQVAPIWKHEYFDDGDAWVEGPVADPADDKMRQQALESACG